MRLILVLFYTGSDSATPYIYIYETGEPAKHRSAISMNRVRGKKNGAPVEAAAVVERRRLPTPARPPASDTPASSSGQAQATG